jgi:hypothetical protein
MDPARLSDAMSAAAHTLAVDQVTAEVVSALRARGVEPVLLKGPSFARWLYPAKTLRPYADSDFLVGPDDQLVAAEVLKSLGFADPMETALEHERDDHSRTFHRRRHGGGDDEVDLHFTLSGARADPQTVWSALTRGLERLDVAGVEVSSLAEPARALHVAWHAAQNSPGTDQPVADLSRAIRVTEQGTWIAAAALAAELDGVAAFAAGLERLPEGDSLLGRLGLRGSSRPMERLRATSPPPMSLGIARLFERKDRRGLAAEIGREVVPTPAFMRLWSPLARRGRVGLILAYLWRPLALLIAAGPAVRAYLRARRSGEQ